MIRALAPAAGGDPNAEWVMLQMSVDGQHVTGETLTFYGPTGTVTGTYVVPGDVSNGLSQRTILLATPQAAAQSGFPTPDFSLNTGDALSPSGGAACLAGSFPADCVSWGTFPSASAHALANPQAFSAEAILGVALGRPIARGCETWLDPTDDTDNSSGDFVDGVPPPAALGEPSPPEPRNNATAPFEIPCQVNTLFDQTPANPTNDTTPTFAFGEVPREYGVAFECRFGPGSSLPGGLAWSACPRSGNTFGPLADGTYSFQAKASGAAGEDPTPATWTFNVDTVPPDTFIDSVPPDPSDGFSASFGFHSSEPHSKFLCQYEAGPIQPCEPGKTIFSLADGSHTFRVWAIDQATNQDPTPALATFNVDTTLGDNAAPDTSILAHPRDPSSSPSASFTYRSSEPRSSFECRLDTPRFSPCSPGGATYDSLANGPHVFAVRATDRAGNPDSVPAAFSWTVKAPLPKTTITAAPPGAQRLRGKAKKARVRFAFEASKPDPTFRCRLDAAPFKACSSPLRLRVAAGRHRFEVYAVDELGNQEPNPARRLFRILPRRRGGGLFR